MKKLIILTILMLSIVSVPSQATELTVWTVTKEDAENNTSTQPMTQQEAFRAPYQDVTRSLCVESRLYCEVLNYDLTMEWVDFGYIEDYDFWLSNGFYIIVWDGDINADEQEIIVAIWTNSYKVLY